MKKFHHRLILATIWIAVLAGSSAYAVKEPPENIRILRNEIIPEDTWRLNVREQNSLSESYDRWVVRAYFSDRQMVNDLVSWIEPWEVHHDLGYLVLAVSVSEISRLQSMGFQVEIDQPLTAQLNAPLVLSPEQTSGIPGYPCYRTVDETYADAESLASAYPNLAAWIDIGDSWELTHPEISGGSDLKVLRLTNATIPGIKPKTFIMGSIHAREYAPAELVTRFGEFLLANYGIDADVTWLLDYHEIHLLPQPNPDGRKHAELGVAPDNLWRKNTNQDYCSPTSNYRGADLNRNFEFNWGCCGGSSSDPCSEVYRGPAAVSEPETQAIQNYLRAEFPDQNGPPPFDEPVPDTASGVFIDLHAYGRLFFMPWGYTDAESPNHTTLQTLARKLSFFNNYRPQLAYDLYVTDGNTIDFVYGELGLAAFAMEVGTRFEYCSGFENSVLPDNIATFLHAAKVSRTPYMLASGPDVIEISATPNWLNIGAPINLTAVVDDTRYNSSNGIEEVQNIAGAEFYVDNPPWIEGAIAQPHALSPSDGEFDESIEAVEGSFDPSDLSPGRHIIYLRGVDADGHWGPFSAIFVHINIPTYFPLIIR